MAVPKRKMSKSRRDKRRAEDKLQIGPMSVCNNCGQNKIPYHLCMSCKTYNGISFFAAKSGKVMSESN